MNLHRNSLICIISMVTSCFLITASCISVRYLNGSVPDLELNAIRSTGPTLLVLPWILKVLILDWLLFPNLTHSQLFSIQMICNSGQNLPGRGVLGSTKGRQVLWYVQCFFMDQIKDKDLPQKGHFIAKTNLNFRAILAQRWLLYCVYLPTK